MANPFLPGQQRVADMHPKAFRLLIRDAVAWGVLMANVLLGLMIGMLMILIRLMTTN